MMRRFKKTVGAKDLLQDLLGSYSFAGLKKVPGIQGHHQTREDFGDKEIAGWFLGTKGENINVFCQLITEAIEAIAYGRRSFHPDDPGYVTEEVKHTRGYLNAIQSLKDNFYRMTAFLNEYSVPFFSMRYQGHMNWDVTLPALVGYFTAMLQNQNNVTIQASPATTFFEIFAGDDMCNMIGFKRSPLIQPWGHITCDGSVANLEALWSARELRFLPVGIKAALDEEYPQVKDDIKVKFGGTAVKLIDLDAWQLLNLGNDEILNIPPAMAEILKQSEPQKYRGKTIDDIESGVWECLASQYSLNTLGITQFYEDDRFLGGKGIQPPAVIVPSSKHYSWPKAASLLGMGHGPTIPRGLDPQKEPGILLKNGLINVWVDEKARMNINKRDHRERYIESLEDVLSLCRAQRKPVLLTVAVMGSTEESAVDPLADIIGIRNEYREGKRSSVLDFNIHADAAWGGYLISIIRENFDIQLPDIKTNTISAAPNTFIRDTANVPLSEYTIRQLQQVRNCDSATVDPHKWGYVPYPAGSLCYRNGKMINLVTFGAPYIQSGEESQALSIGESGVEGSKPGAAAAAVYLSHCVIRPSVKGYGKIMRQSLFNAKFFYAYMVCMNIESEENGDSFFVMPFNEPPPGPRGGPGVEYIKNNIYDKTIDEILGNKEVMGYFKAMGADQNFVDYIFNFYVEKDGHNVPNTDPGLLLKLHDKLFEKVYPQPKIKISHYNVMVSRTTFHREDYGDIFMNKLAERLRLADPGKVEAIPCMRSVVMDPWVIETKAGNKPLNFFKEVFIPELRRAVVNSVEETKREAKKLVYEVDNVRCEILKSEPPRLLIAVDGKTRSGGWYEPELVTVYDDYPGRRAFEFRAFPGGTDGSGQVLTPISVKYVLDKWEDIEEIMVIAGTNHKTVKIEVARAHKLIP
jgi:glutamate/tyrosine decarboxylase-like PLP-dependent enzyme